MAPKLCQLVDRWASITASVSLSDTDSYSYGDEESGEGRGPAPPRTSADGQPLAAGTRQPSRGSGGGTPSGHRQQADQKGKGTGRMGKGNWRNPSRRGERMAKAKKVAGIKSAQSVPLQTTCSVPVRTILPCKKKGNRTGAKGNCREQEQRADRKEKEVQEAAKTDEANAAAPEKTRPARKTHTRPPLPPAQW